MAQLKRPNTLRQNEIALLEESIRQHSQIYYEGVPEISDAAFDALKERLRALKPDSPVLSEVGAPVQQISKDAPTRAHYTPMLSLRKVTTAEEVDAFLTAVRTCGVAGPAAGSVTASIKVDGLAISLIYRNGVLASAVTRGDGAVGEEVLPQVCRIPNIPHSLKGKGGAKPLAILEVRGEVYVKRSVFGQYFADKYASERHFAVGAVRNGKVADLAENLSFFAYDLLRVDGRVAYDSEQAKASFLDDFGFTSVPQSDPLDTPESVAAMLEYLESTRTDNTFDCLIDGVVLKATRAACQTAMGTTADSPRYAVAYKFSAESAVATLLDVVWQPAKSGVIAPVAVLSPVSIGGVTITRASLFNLRQIRERGLYIGALVKVSRRGDVIPHVEGLADERPITPRGPNADIERNAPTTCPSCGAETSVDLAGVMTAAHTSECREVALSKLLHYTSVLKIRGWGDALLGALFDAGVVGNLPSLYAVTSADLQQFAGCTEYGARGLLMTRDTVGRNPEAVAFLTALGVPRLGEGASRKSLAVWGTVRAVLSAVVEDKITPRAQKSVGPAVCDSLRACLVGDTLKEYLYLADCMKAFVYEASSEDAGSTTLATFRVAVTGTFTSSGKSRSEIESLIRLHGGQVSGPARSGDANGGEHSRYLLVVGSKAPQGDKLTTALRLRANIVRELDFLACLEGALALSSTLTPEYQAAVHKELS